MFGPYSYILIPITAILTFGWVVYTIVEGLRRKERMRTFTEFYGRLLDRMQSPKEFGDFLQTSGGQRFLETLSVERGHPIDRVLRAVQAGLVLLMVGLGFMAASTQAAWATDDTTSLRVSCINLMMTGVGYLLSATASFGITKSLGMLKRPPLSDPHDLHHPGV
jgi:hypothetical protein